MTPETRLSCPLPSWSVSCQTLMHSQQLGLQDGLLAALLLIREVRPMDRLLGYVVQNVCSSATNCLLVQ